MPGIDLSIDVLVNRLVAIFTGSAIMNIGRILLIFAVAWLCSRLSWRIAGLFLLVNRSFDPFFPHTAVSRKWTRLQKWIPPEFKSHQEWREERRRTLQDLLGSAISISAFVLAILISAGQFVSQETVVWMAGLFGTALAFAGRTFIGDILAGISIIFEDRYNVGEKILVKSQFELIEGVVEHVSLNATWLRAQSGELYAISNGEIRFIRNYSRGLHSAANIRIKIAAADLERTLPLLKDLGQEIVKRWPEIREPWQVISESGTMGQNVELTLAVKVDFGQAADLRPHLLALVQKRLKLADITLVD